jgi:ParB family chromosome partitioning protein
MKVQNEVINIPINMIKQNSYQPRKYFDQESLMELAESIKEYGVLQPISVRKNGTDFYELIAGERRLRASQLAGLNDIPAIIVDISDAQSALMALIENLQREDLNFFEEAEGYYSLIKDHGLTQEELASKLGKKQSTIANKLRILKLPDEVKKTVKENGLTERHARALLKLPDEKCQIKVLNEVVKRNLNVKATEDLIERELFKINAENKQKNKKVKYKWTINPRVITNTLKQIMDKNGINAEYSHREKEDYLEIIVKIPKAN